MSSCKSVLTALREAIDAKLPEDQRCKKTIAQMTAAVQGLEVGGGGVDTSDATITAADVRFDQVAYGKKGRIVGTMNELVATPIIIETAGSHNLDNGYYEDCSIEVYHDNHDETNIRAGVNVFGVTGTFTADATATAADIAKGKTAGVKGEMITGTLEATASSEGIEFYECSSYTPCFAGGLEYSFTLSGAPEDVANGTYKRTKWVENPTEEWSDTPLAEWVNEKGCKFREFYYSEYSYAIVGPSGILYEPDSPYWTRVTDYNQISWVDSEYWEPVSLTFSPWQTSELPPAVESWSGYKVMQNTETGAWMKSDILKENMKVGFLKPKVGEIYSEDTSIRVRKMFDGAVYPITSDGLVFYAPLQSDYVDQISGKAAQITGGTFTEHNGLRCLEMDGSDYIKWANNSDLPVGSAPYSFVALIAPTNINDWKCYVSMGAEGENEVCIHAKGGRLEEFGSACVTADGAWQSVMLTRDNAGGAKAYYNGKLQGSGSRTNSVPNPACVCVGANISNDFGQKFNGYIAFAAIYDRELTADEVQEIHNTLMDM